MDAFFDNAQRLFDVARSDDSTESNDFALLIRPDGGLHFVMESPVSLEAAAVHGGARTAYRVTKTANGTVRVTGRDGDRECTLQQYGGGRFTEHVLRDSSSHRFCAELLRDQPFYSVLSPLELSAAS